MKINKEMKTKYSIGKKLKESYIPVSEYDILKLIAYRLKDVRPLFPNLSRMGRDFAASIRSGK